MASGPITSWQIDGETVETVAEFILRGGAPKSLQMVTAAMKLKDPNVRLCVGPLNLSLCLLAPE